MFNTIYLAFLWKPLSIPSAGQGHEGHSPKQKKPGPARALRVASPPDSAVSITGLIASFPSTRSGAQTGPAAALEL